MQLLRLRYQREQPLLWARVAQVAVRRIDHTRWWLLQLWQHGDSWQDDDWLRMTGYGHDVIVCSRLTNVRACMPIWRRAIIVPMPQWGALVHVWPPCGL
jgi:hypothetical protein